ncbi:MAG: cytochrome c-type biogenesis CcmF C-terminal domain-containing protein [bacterium]
MKFLGSIALFGALYVTVVGLAISWVAGMTQSRRFLQSSRYAAYASTALVATASAVLQNALLSHDFSIQYVASFSDRSMHLFYLIGSLWGGQAGSLLFWTSIVTFSMSAVVYLNRDRYQDMMPWVTFTALFVQLGLLLILCFGTNPFDGFSIIDDPVTGKGLNPLLQTPKMVIHPPSLLAGMATMTIPFAFAMAALITRNFSNAWVEASRKWILIPWFFLSIGNMLGGMWAYEELGWGGYWAWDPVENAAFMPWLTTSALLHSLMIQERRGMLKRWNLGLMIGSFVLTLFGTYITRSGLIQSVHSFAQSDIGIYFLILLLTMSTFGFGMFLYRWRDMKPEQRLDSPVSKEAAFIFNNWLFMAMTAVVWFGTMWPRIKEGFFGQEVSIGPTWFNRWMAPMGLVLLLLMGIGTIISWRRATLKNFKKNFLLPILATVVGTPALLAAYWYGRAQYLGVEVSPNDTTYGVIAIGLILFVFAAIVEEVTRGVAARMRMHSESAPKAMLNLVAKQRRRYGGYMIHISILCAFLAFAGNALKIEKDVSIARCESITIGDYEMTYKGLRERNDPDKLLIISDLDVRQRGEFKYTIHPGKAIFHASPNMPTSEIDIRSSVLEDFYVALVNFEPNGERAAFKVFVAPFTWWFWLGGALLCLGTLIAMWPTREGLRRARWSPASMARVAFVATLCLLSFAPIGLLAVESWTDWGSALRWEHIPPPAPPAVD